mgnify:CR=1 FL=1
MAQFNAVSSSVGSTYTGSIAKVLALGANDAECTLSNIDFGNMTNPETSFTPTSNISTAIIVPAGSYVEGPIGRLKVDAGGFLIYFNE